AGDGSGPGAGLWAARRDVRTGHRRRPGNALSRVHRQRRRRGGRQAPHPRARGPRSLRRRRARRSALRRAPPDRLARDLGTGAAGHAPRAGGAEADRGAGRHLRVRAPRLPPRGELGRRVRVRPGHREHRPAAARTRLPSRRGAVDGRATGRRAPRARERHPDPNRGRATALPHQPTRHTARDGLRSEAEVAMATTTGTGVYYDPYDVGINADPYPVFRRLREEAPLYRNDEHDFYALSRFDDVERGLVDRETYI